MYLKIFRGTGQIGGNLIEVGTASTRLMFDAGTNLPPLDDTSCDDRIEVEGLTQGIAAFDAVFISHHHNDHCGLLDRILPCIPVWAGRETARILNVISDFTNGTSNRVTNFFEDDGNCLPVTIGDITITPIGVDHSAYDAYMFLIQADGKNVLYTGDYRAVEEVPETVQRVIGVAGKLDVLITEGTNIRYGQQADGRTTGRILQDEVMVEEEIVKVMESHDGTIFVLCSSTNEPRIRVIDAACKRAGRIPCHDLFLTAVRGELAWQDECKPQSFVARYVSAEKTPGIYPYFSRCFGMRQLVGAESLASVPQRQTIFIRTSMLPFLKKYLETRGGTNHALIYSIWEGYKQTSPVQRLLEFCAEQEMEVFSIHCSGHACYHSIKSLIFRLDPTTLIPIHCDSDDRSLFEKLHPRCVLLQDGERMEV